MDAVIAFLLRELLRKLEGDNMADSDAEAYHNGLRTVYESAKTSGLSVAALTSAIHQADPGNGTLAEVVKKLKEEFE